MVSKDRLMRYWTYFRRGHSVYLAFAMSFLNFVVIQYRLLVEYVPLLQELFSHLFIFAIAFFLVYAPVSIVIGWVDYKRGSVPMDTVLMAKASPYNIDLARAIMLLAQGKSEEVIELMEKWTQK
ncbi:MAG: hypothetical protein ACETV1_03350 [Candidatus Bathyarchaeia archaeon]